MLLLQIKRAETALKHGRLEEAWQIASRPRVRGHRRGQQLIQNLLLAWTQRGQHHLQNNRLDQAMQDYRKAAAIEPQDPQVAQLGEQVKNALRQHDHQQRHQNHLLQHAADRIAAGSWTAARLKLDELQDSRQTGVSTLMNDLDTRQQRLKRHNQTAADAIEARDWSRAASAITQAQSLRASDATSQQLRRQLIEQTGPILRQACIDARLAEAQPLAALLSPLSQPTDPHATLIELLNTLTSCRTALACSDLDNATRHAERAATLLPEANWLSQLARELQQAHATLRNAQAGPLAALASIALQDHHHHAEADTRSHPHTAQPAKPAPKAHPEPATPQRTVLSIDGVGSFLICPHNTTRIGPATHPNIDIPLLTDPSTKPLTFQRDDETYALRSEESSQILQNDQRISLPPNNRLRFRQPHPASMSAVIEILRGRIANSDARCAILFDSQFIIGAGPQAHIRVDTLDPSLIIYTRPDGLYARPTGTDHKSAIHLKPEQSIAINGLRMRLEQLQP